MTKPFGRRILQARLDLAARRGSPMSQAEVAAALGVTGVTVGRWEAGKKEPDFATLERLAAVLETDPAWLAFGRRSAPPTSGGGVSPTAARLPHATAEELADLEQELAGYDDHPPTVHTDEKPPSDKRRTGGNGTA